MEAPQRLCETRQQASGAFQAVAQQDVSQRFPGSQVFQYEEAVVRVRQCGVGGQQPRRQCRIEFCDKLQGSLFSVQLCWIPAYIVRVIPQPLHYDAGRHAGGLRGQVAAQDEPWPQSVNGTYADRRVIRGRDKSFNSCACWNRQRVRGSHNQGSCQTFASAVQPLASSRLSFGADYLGTFSCRLGTLIALVSGSAVAVWRCLV